MDKLRLESVMKLHGDTGEVLAKHLNIARITFSAKLNGKSEFTRAEILKIKERYSLSAEEVDAIFFK